VPTPDAPAPTPDAPAPTPDAPAPTPDAPAPTPDAPPASIDISGTHVSRVTTTGTISVPLISNQPANIDIVLRIVVDQSGGNLSSHLELCRVNTATTSGSLVVNFPSSVLTLLTDDQTVPAPALAIGGPVPLPAFDVAVGQNMADSDSDGNPGVTIPTNLLGTSIQAHSGLHISLSFPSATLTDANTITGESAFATDGEVFNTVPLGLMGDITVTPGAPTTAFTALRLDGDVPCSEVVGMFP
jgi:hypothetical protein